MFVVGSADVFLGHAADRRRSRATRSRYFTCAPSSACAMTSADATGSSARIAAASSSVTRGLLCCALDLVVGAASRPVRWTVNASAPTPRLDRVLDARVQALHERHDGDDRRHRHDVAEHRQERAELVRPDRLQRDAAPIRGTGASALSASWRGAGQPPTVFTASPSFRPRTDANGPVMTSSPSFRPSSTSKYFSPAMPVLTGVKTAWPSLIDEHAFDFLARLAGLELGRAARVGAAWRRAAASGARLAHDLALVVDDHLAHRHRLNRHATSPSGASRS